MLKVDADTSGRFIYQIANATAQTDSIGTILYFVVLFTLILFHAAFAATEIAVITLNDTKIKTLAEEGDKTAGRILKFIEGPSGFLSTIRVGLTFAGFFASALAAYRLAAPFTEFIDPGGRVPMLWAVSVFLITLLLSFVFLVFGEMVPKRVAMKNPSNVISYTLWIVILAGGIMKPFVSVLTFSSNLVLRIIGINPNEHERRVTEEEIRMMINVGRETGTIHDSEKEMIENIFELNDTQVSEIMTHRTDLISLSCDASFDEVLQIAVNEKFTRIPVYRDSIDNIIGVLHIKDLLVIAVEGLSQPFNLGSLIREPMFVPETKTIDEVFRQMQSEHAQIAVVIDEYGGTAGIITIEDLLEEIVGNMQDEYDEEEDEIVRESENTVIAEGKAGLDEIAEELDVKFPEDGDYDTIAGLFMDILGRIPDEGEQPQVEYENLVMKVLEMSERRILKIRITVRPPEENPEDEADEKTSENSREEKSKTDSPEKGYEDIEKKKMDLMNEKNKK